jgi:hypothetical protein
MEQNRKLVVEEAIFATRSEEMVRLLLVTSRYQRIPLLSIVGVFRGVRDMQCLNLKCPELNVEQHLQLKIKFTGLTELIDVSVYLC